MGKLDLMQNHVDALCQQNEIQVERLRRARMYVPSGMALLRAAEKHGLEGVVSNRRGTAYRSGDCRHWGKIKTATWCEAW